MADAGWHGRVTGSSIESRIPSKVLRNVPESMLRRMRPDMLNMLNMLLVEKISSDGVQLSWSVTSSPQEELQDPYC